MKGLEMVKCKSLRINMFLITHTGKSVNFPVTQDSIRDAYDAFHPEPTSSSFIRPTSDMNIASGWPVFISHKDLRHGGYIPNDTVFIKITVETTGLQGDIWQ